MAVIIWLVLGAIAGVVARSIVPGDDPGGALAAIIVGIVGALVGGWIGNVLAHQGFAVPSLWSIILSLVSSAVLLSVYRTALKHAP